ncbi:DNA gyrase subunit A, partial [Staphylococcus epidermidis]|uniref:DNA gyrase subunit A n=1 Tax=Staphylococcus epidermidis TaxID=1282 RepID=UPI0037D9A76B
YLHHQKTLLTPPTEYNLKKPTHPPHILQPLPIPLHHIHQIITTIPQSHTHKIPIPTLQHPFKLTQPQPQPILHIRLTRLTPLQTHKIQSHYNQLLQYIKQLQHILPHQQLLLQLLPHQFTQIKHPFPHQPPTEIQLPALQHLQHQHLIPQQQIVITLTHNNYIKPLPL